MNNVVWILAGLVTLVSVWLSQAVSQWWLLLAVVVGAYLAVSGYTGNCPVRRHLERKCGGREDNTEDW
jgi:hypothetical protein